MDNSKYSIENNSIEALLQENCSLKLKNTALEKTVKELSDDNELLFNKLSGLEKNMLHNEKTTAEYKDKISRLELELSEINETFNSYKEEVKIQMDSKNDQELKKGENDKDGNGESLISQLWHARAENDTLIADLLESKAHFKKIENEYKGSIVMSKTEIENLQTQLEETKYVLESKKNTIIELTAVYDEIKEEKLLLSSELAALKSNPSDLNSRGNSLFGELEDRRKAMSNKFKMLYNKYVLLKSNFVKQNKDYELLKSELITLRKKWFNMRENGPKTDQRLIDAQMDRIKFLEETVKELEKRPEDPTFKVIDQNNLSWALSFIEKARNEATKVRHELDRYSMNQYTLEVDYNSKMRTIMRLEEEILTLKSEILDLKVKNEIKGFEEKINSSNVLKESTENKENKEEENDNRRRKVHFEEPSD